jgi:predicted acyltransferase
LEAFTIHQAENIAVAAPGNAGSAPPTRPERTVSLDVFRGATIAAMILVNDPGSWSHVYPPLEHAEWNGWTPTDLIFPFFLFIVGVSLTLSFASRIARGISRRALVFHVVRRSALIFFIGLFLNGFPSFDISSIRIMGVLQRIALCYLAAGLLYLFTFQTEARAGEPTRVCANLRVTAIVAITLLVGYWALLTFIPVPGYGAGHLGKDDNLSAYIDRSLLGGHLWEESKTWDPEGCLSTLPAIASLLVGILAGEWLRSNREGSRKALGLAIVGLVLLVVGRLLHPLFPINKNLWTSSFVLFTSGCAMLTLAACYWIADVRRLRTWAKPFLVFGTNAILAYALAALVSELSTDFEFTNATGRDTTAHGWIYQRFFVAHLSPINASLGFAIFFVLMIFLLLWPFYRWKVFLRV